MLSPFTLIALPAGLLFVFLIGGCGNADKTAAASSIIGESVNPLQVQYRMFGINDSKSNADMPKILMDAMNKDYLAPLNSDQQNPSDGNIIRNTVLIAIDGKCLMPDVHMGEVHNIYYPTIYCSVIDNQGNFMVTADENVRHYLLTNSNATIEGKIVDLFAGGIIIVQVTDKNIK